MESHEPLWRYVDDRSRLDDMAGGEVFIDIGEVPAGEDGDGLFISEGVGSEGRMEDLGECRRARERIRADLEGD